MPELVKATRQTVPTGKGSWLTSRYRQSRKADSEVWWGVRGQGHETAKISSPVRSRPASGSPHETGKKNEALSVKTIRRKGEGG